MFSMMTPSSIIGVGTTSSSLYEGEEEAWSSRLVHSSGKKAREVGRDMAEGCAEIRSLAWIIEERRESGR